MSTVINFSWGFRLDARTGSCMKRVSRNVQMLKIFYQRGERGLVTARNYIWCRHTPRHHHWEVSLKAFFTLIPPSCCIPSGNEMQQKAQVYGFLRAAFMHWKQKALYNFRSLGTYTLLWRRKEKLADCKTRPPLWGLRQFCFRTVFVVYFSWWNFFDCFLTTSWNIQKALASCKRHFFIFWVKHYSVLNGELKRHISKQASEKEAGSAYIRTSHSIDNLTCAKSQKGKKCNQSKS